MTPAVPRDDQGSPELVALLRNWLRDGPVPFARYMDVVLHHPEHGYYAKPDPVVGTDGDFLTSPALHPAFGRMLWRQVEEMLDRVGAAATYRVLEIGAGAGQMARDLLLEARRSGRGGVVRYLIREESRRLRQQQRRTILAAWPDAPVAWVETLDQARPVHVVLMNELMSALPVHRLVRDEHGRWQELYVRLEGDGFALEPGPVSEPRAVEAVEAGGVEPVPGQIVDVNVAAVDMLRAISACLADRAFILNIDYGGPAQLVYRPSRPRGSLRCYYRQALVDDPFARPGRQDITADVDFDLLARAGHALGLRSAGPIPQGAFLLNLGIEEEALALARRIAQGDGAAEFELQKVYALYAPEALGEAFWVMVHARGFRRLPPLCGFHPAPVPRTFAELVMGDRR